MNQGIRSYRDLPNWQLKKKETRGERKTQEQIPQLLFSQAKTQESLISISRR